MDLYPINYKSDASFIEIANGESKVFIAKVNMSGEEKRLGHKIPVEVRVPGATRRDVKVILEQHIKVEHGMRYGSFQFNLGCSFSGNLTSNDHSDDVNHEGKIRKYQIYTIATHENVSSPNVRVSCVPP